jgi:hypothetical protein
MDSEERANVLALTEHGRSLLDRIDASLEEEQGAGSDMVLELREIVNALRLIFPPQRLTVFNGNKSKGNAVGFDARPVSQLAPRPR